MQKKLCKAQGMSSFEKKSPYACFVHNLGLIHKVDVWIIMKQFCRLYIIVYQYVPLKFWLWVWYFDVCSMSTGWSCVCTVSDLDTKLIFVWWSVWSFFQGDVIGSTISIMDHGWFSHNSIENSSVITYLGTPVEFYLSKLFRLELWWYVNIYVYRYNYKKL
jgi:hypothetical protein